MTENVITVALIAIAAIGIVTLFGQNLRTLYANAVNAVTGNENADVAGRAAGAPGRKNLMNFGVNTEASTGVGGGGAQNAPMAPGGGGGCGGN